MGSQSRRRWTAEEKLAIIEEARQAGQAVSEVCRRHGIGHKPRREPACHPRSQRLATARGGVMRLVSPPLCDAKEPTTHRGLSRHRGRPRIVHMTILDENRLQEGMR